MQCQLEDISSLTTLKFEHKYSLYFQVSSFKVQRTVRFSHTCFNSPGDELCKLLAAKAHEETSCSQQFSTIKLYKAGP